jgi:nitrogen regulatory protein PII
VFKLDKNAGLNTAVIVFCIVNDGKATDILESAKKIGVNGGTIFHGRGTVKNSILEFLGLHKVKKEILIMALKEKFEDELHEYLTDKFQLYRPNNGILFSCSLNRIIGARCFDDVCTAINHEGEKSNMEYEVIFTVVDSGRGDEVVEAATAAGARGATIIDARGSAVNEKSMIFDIEVEKDKEIVMIIAKKDICPKIVESIEESMELEKPGKGVMFTMDVNRTSGLYTGKK